MAEVLDGLKTGRGVLQGCHCVYFAPVASGALVEIFAGAEPGQGKTSQVLLWGPRGGGKTVVVPAGFLGLAELDLRAGYGGPMRAIWLHPTLQDAASKTVDSLTSAPWAPVWTLRDDKREAVATVAATEMVVAAFVGSQDSSAAERIRSQCRVVGAEELMPALSQGGGVAERDVDVAISSARLPTRRRVLIATTNPGDEESWPFRRWLAPEHPPECIAIEIPPTDRMTADEVARLRESFVGSPDLRARLALGVWTGLQLGPVVAKGFNAARHVAPEPLSIGAGDVWCGWDSAPNAHTHAVTIGQRLGGRAGLTMIRVYACLVAEDTGLKQFLEAVVVPWFSRRIPHVLGRGGGERLLHRYDPAMNSQEGGDYDANPLGRIRAALGGSFWPGAVDWPSRIGPVLALFNQGDGRGGPALQICPGEDARPLTRALSGAWYFATTRGGVVIRDLPAKPNHPHEDAGDSFCYFVGGVSPSRDIRPRQKPRVVFNWDAHRAWGGS